MAGASYQDLEQLLNPAQLEAATTLEGPLLILAGAGSGKTRVLVHRAAHILHEGRAEPWQMFLVTFTNKAAKEMRERLEKLIGPEVRSAWIGTFHALSARMLRQEGHRLGYGSSFTIYDADDSKRLVKKIMGEMGIDTSARTGIGPPQVISAIDRAKNKGETPEDYERGMRPTATPAEKIAVAVYYKYRNALKRANAMDFGDLLLLNLELMKHHPEARERYARRFRYVMVDEFQDTNRVQYELLERLVGIHKNLAVVGDDDQSIYRWRGAEVSNILGFEKNFPKAKVVKLEQNYRSTKNVITAANAVIQQNSKRHDKTLFTDSDAGAPVGLGMFDYGDEEAMRIAHILEERIAGGAEPTDFAILYRQNAQSRAFEEALMRARVPYVLIGGTGFYERREVKDILAYLRLTANPHSRADFERVVNVPPRKIGATTIERLRKVSEATGLEGARILEADDAAMNAAGLKGATLKRLRELGVLLEKLRAYSVDNHAAEVALHTIEAIDYEGYLDKSDPVSADDRKANVEELVSSIAEHEETLGEALSGPEDEPGLGLAGAKTPLQAFLDQASLVSADDGEDKTGVQLLTLHSAKGLEFPVVFMVGLEEMTFPPRRIVEQMDNEAIEEERRLCYVGMTRAMKELYLTTARMRRIYGQAEPRRPSRFLAELPPSVIGTMPLSESQRKRTAYARPSAPPTREVRATDRGGDRVEYDAPARAPEAMPLSRATPGDDPEVGDRIRHNLFGFGKVVAREGPGPKGRLTIEFATERKKVLSKFVQKA